MPNPLCPRFWLDTVHADGYRSVSLGPFDSQDDARLALDAVPDKLSFAAVTRDGVELDWWQPGKGWEGDE